MEIQFEVDGNDPLYCVGAIKRHPHVAAHRPQVGRLLCTCSLHDVGSDWRRQARNFCATQKFRNAPKRRDSRLDGKVRDKVSYLVWRSRVRMIVGFGGGL